MYLDGQLPGGPPSSNTGGHTTTDAISALFGDPMFPVVNPKAGANPLDQLPDSFYTVPDGGPVVVSPTLAKSPNIVQYPLTHPQGMYAPQIDLPAPNTACGLSDLQDPKYFPSRPVAPPSYIDSPGADRHCPGYANDGSLVSLREDAFRSGLAGCCNSGYQGYEKYDVVEKPSPLPWIIAAAGLILLTETKRGSRF